MDAADIHIRRLTPADAALYRGIRLEGLNCNPEAFGSTFEAEFSKPLAWFFDRLSNTQIFGAFRGPDILGVAGFAVRDAEKEVHKGLLWGCAVTRRRFPVGARPTRRFAPAGSNRSRHGGDEMSEAFG